MTPDKVIKELKNRLGLSITATEFDTMGYNEWLDRLRKVPAGKLRAAEEWLEANIPGEGFAAVERWLDIYDTPARIDKLLQSKLDKDEEEDLMALAVGDDQETFYVALVKKTARELNNAATAQEVARLSMNLKIFQGELANIRSKRAKKGSLLDKIMQASAGLPEPPQIAKKRPKAATKKKGAKCKQQQQKTTKKAKRPGSQQPSSNSSKANSAKDKASAPTVIKSKEMQNENDHSH